MMVVEFIAKCILGGVLVGIGLVAIGLLLIFVRCIYDATLNGKRAQKMMLRQLRHKTNTWFNRLYVSWDATNNRYEIKLENENGHHIMVTFNDEKKIITNVSLSERMARLSENHPELEEAISKWVLHAKEVIIPTYERETVQKESNALAAKEKREEHFLRMANQSQKTKE